jgi:protein O-GlcNAc transferase
MDDDIQNSMDQTDCQSNIVFADEVNTLKRKIALKPDNAEFYCELGWLYRKNGQQNKALQCFHKAVSLKPNLVFASINIGLILSGLLKLNDAVRVLEKALLQTPNDFSLLNNLGVIYRDQGKLLEAAKCFQKAQILQAGSFAVCFNLANTLREMKQYKAARTQYQMAAKLNSDDYLVFIGLGQVHMDLCQYDLAVNCFKKALKIRPDNEMALSNLVNGLMFVCDWSELEKWNQQLDQATQSAIKLKRNPEEMPFLNLSRHANPKLNLAVAKAWSKKIETGVSYIKSDLRLDVLPMRKSKITIGYLSNNFKNHPTSHLIHPIFSLHNRKIFNVFCYSYGENDNSNYRVKIERECDNFVDLRQYGDEDAARHICYDQVDILIDLSGYLNGARPEICAIRPAPIQIRWLGMAGSSGAKFYDYLLADRIVIPEHETRYYTEKIIYLPNCYQINSNDALINSTKKEKKEYGLPDEGFIFAAFHTAYKIDANTFDIWMRILKQVPKSVLWLMPGSQLAERNLKNAAACQGVEPCRLIMAKKIPKDEHLSRLQQADLILDTITINGAITTSDAIKVGVPVLTMKGKHFASRMAASILTAVGLTELIVDTQKKYEKFAIILAVNPEKLNLLRIKLSQNLIKMPLFQIKRFVQDLEEIYLSLDRKEKSKFKSVY